MSDDEQADAAFARGDNDERARRRAEPLVAVRAFIDGRLGIFLGPGSCDCSDCPFAEALFDPYPPNRHDRSEGHYRCHLTGEPRVWGESPTCTTAQWQDRARAELAELGVEVPT